MQLIRTTSEVIEFPRQHVIGHILRLYNFCAHSWIHSNMRLHICEYFRNSTQFLIDQKIRNYDMYLYAMLSLPQQHEHLAYVRRTIYVIYTVMSHLRSRHAASFASCYRSRVVHVILVLVLLSSSLFTCCSQFTRSHQEISLFLSWIECGIFRIAEAMGLCGNAWAKIGAIYLLLGRYLVLNCHQFDWEPLP